MSMQIDYDTLSKKKQEAVLFKNICPNCNNEMAATSTSKNVEWNCRQCDAVVLLK